MRPVFPAHGSPVFLGFQRGVDGLLHMFFFTHVKMAQGMGYLMRRVDGYFLSCFYCFTADIHGDIQFFFLQVGEGLFQSILFIAARSIRQYGLIDRHGVREITKTHVRYFIVLATAKLRIRTGSKKLDFMPGFVVERDGGIDTCFAYTGSSFYIHQYFFVEKKSKGVFENSLHVYHDPGRKGEF